MRFASLGSGSRGNAMVVEVRGARVLLDCGFGARELHARLARIGLVPGDLSAILVTHEHSDHSAGVFKCARRYDLEVILTHGTLSAMPRDRSAPPRLRVIDSHRPFVVGEMEIQPFPVPHDAREPVQFVFSDGHHRLGVLTDTGSITRHIVDMLSPCDALVLECNHDSVMLENGSYPRVLKQRIGGRYGHLDNQTAAALLGELDRTRLQHVVAAHISEQNNTPQLARSALAGVLGCSQEWVGVASQEEGFAWRELTLAE
ncbi:MAG: MBL fold metallo-hydrolase [Betaproteobacteria bacterium]|nr:MBL fold metallo-hydrolase [Betaproteobacteria bacterium]